MTFSDGALGPKEIIPGTEGVVPGQSGVLSVFEPVAVTPQTFVAALFEDATNAESGTLRPVRGGAQAQAVATGEGAGEPCESGTRDRRGY